MLLKGFIYNKSLYTWMQDISLLQIKKKDMKEVFKIYVTWGSAKGP